LPYNLRDGFHVRFSFDWPRQSPGGLACEMDALAG
jgi:hypothetical protein